MLAWGDWLAGWASSQYAWLVIPALNTPTNFGVLRVAKKDLERL